MAPRPAARSLAVSRSCRQAVISEVLPGRSAETQSSRPRSSVSADHEQAMAFALAGVVLPVLFAGAPPGADQRAVQQHHPATLVGDLFEGAVQARGAGGQQADDFPHSPGHGGAVYPVAAGQVARPLVTAQYREHDGGDLPRGQGPPPRPDLLAVAAYQVGEPVQGGTRQRQAGSADKAVRTLDGTVVFLHIKLNCRRGPASYAPAASASLRPERLRLAVADRQPEDLAMAGDGGGPGRDGSCGNPSKSHCAQGSAPGRPRHDQCTCRPASHRYRTSARQRGQSSVRTPRAGRGW